MPRHHSPTILLVLALTTGLVSVSAPAQAAVTCFGRRATIVGTDGRDRLIGTAGNDVIAGLGGRDFIEGRGGNDRICGGGAADDLLGGIGLDRVAGGLRADIVQGGPGNDLLLGGRAHDVVFGRGGHDVIRGGLGGDELFGSQGNDTFQGGRGADFLFGRSGDDDYQGGTGFDSVGFVVFSGVNANLEMGVATGEGDDTITGVEGLFGTAGNDTLTGDAEENLLVGAPGDDELVGGDGPDEVAYFFSSQGVQADLVSGQATGDGTDSLTGIENLTGSFDWNDTLNGDDNDNVLNGLFGDDTGDARGHVNGDTCISIENATNCETIQVSTLRAWAALSAWFRFSRTTRVGN